MTCCWQGARTCKIGRAWGGGITTKSQPSESMGVVRLSFWLNLPQTKIYRGAQSELCRAVVAPPLAVGNGKRRSRPRIERERRPWRQASGIAGCARAIRMVSVSQESNPSMCNSSQPPKEAIGCGMHGNVFKYWANQYVVWTPHTRSFHVRYFTFNPRDEQCGMSTPTFALPDRGCAA